MFVNVLFPINAGAFTYRVPEELNHAVRPGMLVRAPFRRQKKAGVITGPGIPPADTEVKEIESFLHPEPLLTEHLMELLHWIGQYYIAAPGLALKNAVPSGIFEGKRGGKAKISYDSKVRPERPFLLTPEQEKAVSDIRGTERGAFLLHGVTGSGKTEVYLRAIEALGDREAIVLVPEIALTGQIIDRFRSRFGDAVSFLHSGLSPGEKVVQWEKMRKGDVRIAIGVRSAVFSPFRNLSLIIVDEEHESSYKQFEGLRYNARDVALARAKIEGIRAVLGSATPSVESYHAAEKGSIHYIELPHRIERKPLPEVEVIDMTEAARETWSFSRKLLSALRENLSQGHQSLLMLNRRGYAPFLMCRDCGHTHKCPSCSITLTYHKDTKTLKCHYCNSFLTPGDVCPNCNGTRTKGIGAGTQRAEEDLRSLIPELAVSRMDSDTTRRKLSHYRMVKEMEQKKIDLLLGTQMVARGHDFPDVTLSGVVLADIAFNLPDFRSAERTFQLLTQLAGRAGRGKSLGKVYIQTYEPAHYVFDYVRNHDYKGFYRKEIELRREFSYPPFSRLARMLFTFRQKESISPVMKSVSAIVKKSCSREVQVLGPSPAPIEKIRNRWRWHLLLKAERAKTLRQYALKILQALGERKDARVEIDIDPVHLL